MWSACEHRPKMMKTLFENQILSAPQSLSASVDTIYYG